MKGFAFHYSIRLLILGSVLTFFSINPANAQSDASTGTSGDEGVESQIQSLSLFGPAEVRAETNAYLAAWNPDDGSGIIAVDYRFPAGYHQIDNDEFFRIKPEATPGLVFGSTLKAEPVYNDGLAEYYDKTTLLMEFHVTEELRSSEDSVEISVSALFQICNEEGTCLFPDSEPHTVRLDTDSAPLSLNAENQAILDWSQSVSSRVSDNNSVVGEQNRFSPAGSPLLFLLLAFLGGILLNVMPCVLPLLSVKALGLVKQAGADRRSLLKHAWLYVAGIEFSFLTLAVLVIVLQASGRLLGWGFQFQSPVFVLLLTAVIWIFALSLFDLFVIQAPQKGLQGASKAGTKTGYLGSFLTGIFAVLVATPCTAPFLGAALGFAFSQTPLVILSIFAATGLGLGLPFLLLGLWPGFFKRMPKPGAWMNTFKEVMGFLLVGTAVYLLTTFDKLAPLLTGPALWWLLILAFSAWLFGKARSPLVRRAPRIIGTLAALIIAVSSWFILIDLSRAQELQEAVQSTESAYLNFNEEDIRYRIANGEPVFLEFTAAWCTTCKVNQRVINAREIRRLMDDKQVVHIKGDLTSYDETMTRWLADFGRAGVPLYVLFPPDGEAHLFPELLSIDMLARELERLPDAE